MAASIAHNFLQANARVVDPLSPDAIVICKLSADSEKRYYALDSPAGFYDMIQSITRPGDLHGVTFEECQQSPSGLCIDFDITTSASNESQRESITSRFAIRIQALLPTLIALVKEIAEGDEISDSRICALNEDCEINAILMRLSGDGAMTFRLLCPAIQACTLVKEQLYSRLAIGLMDASMKRLVSSGMIDDVMLKTMSNEIPVPIFYTQFSNEENCVLNGRFIAIGRYTAAPDDAFANFVPYRASDRLVSTADGCTIRALSLNAPAISPVVRLVHRDTLVRLTMSHTRSLQSRVHYMAQLADYEKRVISSDLIFICDLLDIIFPRANDVSEVDWSVVISAFANSGRDYKLLAEWFSAETPWYPQFEDRWNLLFLQSGAVQGAGHSSINTYNTKRYIIYRARTVAPEAFEAVRNRHIKSRLERLIKENAGQIENTGVAILLYLAFCETYVVDFENGNSRLHMWYEMVKASGGARDTHQQFKWRSESWPDRIVRYIKEDLRALFLSMEEPMIEQVNEMIARDEHKSLIKIMIAKLSALRRSRINLEREVFISNCVKCSISFFFMRNFVSALDKDETIMPVANGILITYINGVPDDVLRSESIATSGDLALTKSIRANANPWRDSAKIVFMTGFHEFPVMIYSAATFRFVDDPDPVFQERVIEIRNMIAAIIIEDDAREKILTMMSLALDWRTKQLPLCILSGGGANGKSTLLKLWRGAMGSLGANTPLGLLTRPREDSDKPNSAVIQLSKARGTIYSEPNDSETLNPSRIKDLNGQEMQSGRDLNGKQQNFMVNAVQFLGTNFDININTTDHGTWRRIMKYTCKSTFCANPNPTNKYEKQDNKKYIESITSDTMYVSAFLAILVQYYERFHNVYGGVFHNIVSPTIDAETEDYRNTQDRLNKFLTLHVVQALDENGDIDKSVILPVDAIAREYIAWMRRDNPQLRLDQARVIAQIENSRIKNYLTRADANSVFLRGYAVLTEEQRLERMREVAG